jgi:hypothetical protein
MALRLRCHFQDQFELWQQNIRINAEKWNTSHLIDSSFFQWLEVAQRSMQELIHFPRMKAAGGGNPRLSLRHEDSLSQPGHLPHLLLNQGLNTRVVLEHRRCIDERHILSLRDIDILLAPEMDLGSNPGVRAFLPWRFRHTNKLRKK